MDIEIAELIGNGMLEFFLMPMGLLLLLVLTRRYFL